MAKNENRAAPGKKIHFPFWARRSQEAGVPYGSVSISFFSFN